MSEKLGTDIGALADIVHGLREWQGRFVPGHVCPPGATGVFREAADLLSTLSTENAELKRRLAEADAAIVVWVMSPGSEKIAQRDSDRWTEEALVRHASRSSDTGKE